MFGRKKSGSDDNTTETDPSADGSLTAKPMRPLPQASTPLPPARAPNLPPRPAAPEMARPVELSRAPAIPTPPSESPKPATELPRAPAELPRKPSETAVKPKTEADVRQLIVGREIALTGNIATCDRLLVEGSVEANLENGRDLEIAEPGLFKGAATVEQAEIRGRYEGTLTVRKRLYIRATGKVTGTIRYGQIEIECGGQISGDIQSVTPEVKPAVADLPARSGSF